MLKSLPPLMTIQEYLEYRPETARIIGVLSKDEDGYYRIEDDMYTIYLHNLDESVGKKIEPLIGKEVVVFKKDNKFIKVM
ncbi:hypothetical protein, partial [Desulfurobacterium sp.]|uniref:hypothetical protein n=1 Tax=Desulfurobacterium sp. TaxID=2004706 RepID=UPI00261A2B7C